MIGVGEHVGAYTLLKRIGAGALGDIFLAEHRHTGRQVTVNVLLPELSMPGPALDRLLGEMRATGPIRDPGLVDILDVGIEGDGRAFIVMELLDGEALGSYLHRSGPRAGDLPFVLGIGVAAASAMGAAHDAGIVHHGLSPNSVFLHLGEASSRVVTVKILDFGVAMLVQSTGDPGGSRTGVLLGTWAYRSPEQCQGAGQVDARSDVYSLGCLLYEALCGSPPFVREGLWELLIAHIVEAPQPLTAHIRDLPPDLDNAILQMLSKSPEARPQSMREVEAVLRQCAGETGIAIARDLSPQFPVERRNLSSVLSATPEDTNPGAVGLTADDGATASAPPTGTATTDAPVLTGDFFGPGYNNHPRGNYTGLNPDQQRRFQDGRRQREDDDQQSRRIWQQNQPRKQDAQPARAQQDQAHRDRQQREQQESQRLRNQHLAGPQASQQSWSPHQASSHAGYLVPRQAERSHVRLDENVQFTVRRPKVVAPGAWHKLLVFAHLSEKRPDAPPEEPHPIEEVGRQAEQMLGADPSDHPATTADSASAIPEEGELTFIPVVPGIDFNPRSVTFRWVKPVHGFSFDFRAPAELDRTTARGAVHVFLGNLIVAEISLAITVDGPRADAAREQDAARPYRKIFASYSHKDLGVVEEFRTYAQALGDRYVLDCVDLRAGEVWNEGIAKLIKDADVFQLFWSRNSMHSPYVRQEWEFALSLGDRHRIRPTYWEDPLPEEPGLPPAALKRLHFQRIASRTVSAASSASSERPVPRREPATAPPAAASADAHCPNCGSPVPSGFQFCGACGARVGAAAASGKRSRMFMAAPMPMGAPSAPAPMAAPGRNTARHTATSGCEPEVASSSGSATDWPAAPRSSAKRPRRVAFTAGVSALALVLIVFFVAGRGSVRTSHPPTDVGSPRPMETVRIDVPGLPVGTVVTVDGRASSLPILLPKGSHKHEIGLQSVGKAGTQKLEIDATRDRQILAEDFPIGPEDDVAAKTPKKVIRKKAVDNDRAITGF